MSHFPSAICKTEKMGALATLSPLNLHQTLFPKCPFPRRNSLFHSPRPAVLHARFSPSRIRSSSAVAAPEPDLGVHHDRTWELDLLACPICYEPLVRKGPPGLNLPAIYRSGFKCQKCNKTYSSKEVYLDLTVTSGTKDYSEVKPARTELFRSPLVSFLYERGWRQNFNRSGFPGPDEEFSMAQEYFKPAAGGLLVDVSCGSGLFSRKFAKSGFYSGVIALDFSENMLRQCYDFISKDSTLSNIPFAGNILELWLSWSHPRYVNYRSFGINHLVDSRNIALVRADISRLPFSSGSVDAVHAGAALHCWPSPSNAVAEISRVLRSGGVFVGTTFLAPSFGDSLPAGILRPLRQTFSQLSNTYNNLTEEEIKDLCTTCGLVNFSSDVRRSFIMFSAQKP